MVIKTDRASVTTGDTPVALADLSAIRVGDTATLDAHVCLDDVVAFAALSGDDNPLHMSATVANGYGFERPVAHGMLALATISRLIGTRLPGPGSLWVSHDVRFPAPVLVGDELTARVTVEQVSMATGLVALRTEVVNRSSAKTVLAGLARVKVLPVNNLEPAS